MRKIKSSRLMLVLLIGAAVVVATGMGRAGAQTMTAGDIELSVGAAYGQPQGGFDEVADFGFGGYFRTGYWLSNRLAVGATVSGVSFMAQNFWSNIEYYAQFDDLGWNVFALEADVRCHFLRFVHAGKGPEKAGRDFLSGGRQSSLFLVAKGGHYEATFTAKMPTQEIEIEMSSTGFAGGIGYQFFGPRKDRGIFRRVSVVAEALYFYIPTDPQDIRYLVLQGGIGFHFGL